MIYLGVHLNANQLSTQLQSVLAGIYLQSYLPVLRLVEENRDVFFSFNLTKALGDRLPREFLDRLSVLVRDQRMEPLNTASDHYLLPLFPPWVIQRQLARNRQFYREELGINDPIPGIYLPELAYVPSFPSLFSSLGYQWCLADDGPRVMQKSHIPADHRVPLDEVLTFDGCGVLLRSRKWSNHISWGDYQDGSSFAKNLLKDHREWKARCADFGDSYLILALDWETFGHHHPDAIARFLIPFFGEIASQSNVAKIAQLDFIFNHFRQNTIETPLPAGSWSTEDLKSPFPLWNNPSNPFHCDWNEFKDTVFEIAPDNPEAELEELLQNAFYSCSPWWATKESPKNRTVAGWCLLRFRRIIDLLPTHEKKSRLKELHEKMQEFVA